MEPAGISLLEMVQISPRPLSPELWKELDMNKYLDNYPNGNWTDLQSYASIAGALDFQCGIGKTCNPDQLCEAVYGKDWYALVAAQNWNNFVNSLYQAAGDAFDSVAGTLPTMFIDFEKDPTRFPRHVTAYISLFSNWISSFPASLFKFLGPMPGSIWMSYGVVSWVILVMLSFQLTAFGWIETLLVYGNGPDRFTRSVDVSWMLGEAQDAVQGAISNITQKVISSGISTKDGLASVNRDGIFLSSLPVLRREELQKEYEKLLKVKTLIKLWRIQNAFIVRGLDTCDKGGENGAFSGPHKLSYCDQDSIMMSIVRAEIKGDKFDPTIFRASFVQAKYGFSTKFLTTKSWECQRQHGVFEFDPYTNKNGTELITPAIKEDCIVNLPVCDCTLPAIKQAIINGATVTKACREIGGLPI
ncbi:hypothetical protein PPACK8108_LOCUS24342 [Phakopsora pachyrhizi]|uniref:DUF7872 domain-containing protein n=1 Tax=Phakopsora pachyrhizi TaxID=170000 RepID=A0AAV0BSU6_PHAPC|nr:hypothetical protein PPACK8108_LOCUS24342 [Phakopsora pachyrhizi]